MTAQIAAALDTRTLLQRLQIAVENRTQPEVFHLTDILIRSARYSTNNVFLDLAAGVAAEYARGNFERAGCLIADGLYVVEDRERSLAA